MQKMIENIDNQLANLESDQNQLNQCRNFLKKVKERVLAGEKPEDFILYEGNSRNPPWEDYQFLSMFKSGWGDVYTLTLPQRWRACNNMTEAQEFVDKLIVKNTNNNVYKIVDVGNGKFSLYNMTCKDYSGSYCFSIVFKDYKLQSGGKVGVKE